MRKLALLAFAVLSLAGLPASASGSSTTSLTVTYWAQGNESAKPVTWTLRCNPARGTLARPAAACSRLASGGWRLFAPVPKNAVCTEIYGGPQVALVVGVVQGRRIWAKLRRRDGCEVGRWTRLSPWLLPAGGAT